MKNHLLLVSLVISGALAISVLAQNFNDNAHPSSPSTAAAICPPEWRIVASPSFGSGNNELMELTPRQPMTYAARFITL